jgi:hypothetical protein
MTCDKYLFISFLLLCDHLITPTHLSSYFQHYIANQLTPGAARLYYQQYHIALLPELPADSLHATVWLSYHITILPALLLSNIMRASTPHTVAAVPRWEPETLSMSLKQ